ncbi:MAG TPA: SRPBCC family protein [Intrasporangium sp.]|uniref:SRPBCC family protein n=1 Tax=Intrasporangium sp. TaxID=1925024 RepID=UPI002B469E18|nr:SRPBCC family protein [Intrasporangium sp.]HKX67315.1 SRPBCC family protein [Intrasporangium sp.]
MRNLLRGLIGDQLLRRPAPEQREPLDVHHRVLINCDRKAVWEELVTPAVPLLSEDLAVVAIPEAHLAPPTALAVLWRRPNGRLRAGLGLVVGAEPPGLVVTRAVDGSAPISLTTTLEEVAEGCIVDQRLSGITPAHATELRSAFALLWLQRGLIGLKERLEGGSSLGPAAVPVVPGNAGVDPFSARLGAEIAALDATVGGAALVPVAHDEAIELAVSPDALWELLLDPGSEPLVRPHTLGVTTVVAPGAPEPVHVALHRSDDGRRSVTVSQVTEQVRPTRLVERSLTSEFESAVVTRIEPTPGGSRLTESLVGSLPAGAGSLSGAGPAAALLRARLEAIRRLAEAGIQPQRDPRTGFLPPGFEPAPEAPPPPAPVPSPVLLPPPHLPIAVPEHRPPRSDNFDEAFTTWGML